MDWAGVFVPDVRVLLEVVLRGTILYLLLFALLRFVFRREAGTVGITDLLVLVLIADAAQNAMADDYTSITEGVALVSTIIFWSHFLDWLGYRFSRLGRFVHPPPLPLVKGGQMIRSHMRRELITEEELMSQLREQGIEDISEVKSAFLEGDGHLSVIRKKPVDDDATPPRR